jgi:hypothetical protein
MISASIGYSIFLVLDEPEKKHQNERTGMFFVSIGPYENKTHSCPEHVDSCKAEFALSDLNYTIMSKDGEYTIQGTIITGENGFFDLYLPKGKDYIATLTLNDKKGIGIIQTKRGSSNCITDIKVQ